MDPLGCWAAGPWLRHQGLAEPKRRGYRGGGGGASTSKPPCAYPFLCTKGIKTQVCISVYIKTISLSLYIYICAYMRIQVCKCMFDHVGICVFQYICACAYSHVHMCLCICVHTCVYIYIYIFACVNVCVYM